MKLYTPSLTNQPSITESTDYIIRKQIKTNWRTFHSNKQPPKQTTKQI